MTEYRGGPPGAHYSSDSEFHCRGCGVGLATGEACSMKGCPRYGRRANGQAAGGDLLPGDPTPASWLQGLSVGTGRGVPTTTGADARRQLDGQLFDPEHRRAIARERGEAETARWEELETRRLDFELIELRRLGVHPTVHGGPS